MLAQSLTVYLIAFAFSTLFWGPLSDSIGRRMTLLASMSLYLIASMVCALATDVHSFTLLRAGQGLAASGGFITARSMIRDSYDTRVAQKAMAQVTLLFAREDVLRKDGDKFQLVRRKITLDARVTVDKNLYFFG